MSAGHDDLCRWNGIARTHGGRPLGCDCARMRQTRAQIAADIEAARDHFAERTGTPREHPICRAYDDAARIARGPE